MEKLLYYYTRNFALGLALGISVLAGQAAAHPHGWIDVRVNVVVDNEERLVAFEQQWKMDPFYSIALIEELELLAPDNRDEALALMAEEMQRSTWRRKTSLRKSESMMNRWPSTQWKPTDSRRPTPK